MRVIALAALLLLTAHANAADNPNTATGTFKSQGTTLDVQSAVALGGVIHAMGVGHPAKSVQITRGFSSGGKAVLEISGEAPGGKLVGEVFLVKEGDSWRVDDEITELVP